MRKEEKMPNNDLKSNIDKCVDCGACYKVCPMMNSFGESPKKILQDIYDYKINFQDISYSCMLCNACTEVCPKDIDLKDMFHKFRIRSYKHDIKNTRRKFKLRVVQNHQKGSFSKLLTSKHNNKSVKRVFMPGCSLSGYDNEIIFKVKEYLDEKLGDTEIVLKCCGKPSKDIGDIELFNNNISSIEEYLESKNVDEVIVACENCYKTFSESFKNIKVITLWEVMSNEGVPARCLGAYSDLEEEFALHDPCPIKKEPQIHEAVRNILNDLDIKIVEFKKNKSNTECCGSGGMVGVTNKELWEKQKNKRANSTECNNIISYCESCVNTFKSSGKNVLHLLDLIFNEDVLIGKRLNQKEVSTMNQWVNRIKLANKVGREN
ncbi:(Fe-S)-binding protein [Clostridium sp. B9]|uniref:(Fe-S)-binding protein n=1 Tax=Clostridium sp. B9 TaxID=3423224 RepID=UPI003D2F0868